jgi:predicted nucleotidyltransferase
LIERLELIVAAGTPLDDGAIEIYLFGSRARGDWDGYSDVDLLVVADVQASAQRSLGSIAPSPHWRAVRTQASLLLRWPT